MKLLFDHNLSPRLAARLADLFPGSSHVSLHSLDRSSDQVVWDFARENGFTLVTKDSDFGELSALYGFPPKVIWLRLGNCTTQEVEALIRKHEPAILYFDSDPSLGMLTLV